MRISPVGRYIFKSLLYYRRHGTALFLGTVITSAVVTGSLILGDSVRESLKNISLARIGAIRWAMHNPSRYMDFSAARRLEQKTGTAVIPAILTNGIAGIGGGKKRIGGVRVSGVDDRFFALSPAGKPVKISPGSALINRQLARKLDMKKGDEFTLSLAGFTVLPKDSPFSTGDEFAGTRLKVQDIIGRDDFGEFSLSTDPFSKPAVFMRLDYLADKLGVPGRINTLLVSSGAGVKMTVSEIDTSLASVWEFEDTGLSMEALPDTDLVELTSGRVFISDEVTDTVMRNFPKAESIFSYFVNSIQKGKKTTPYSIISSPPQHGSGIISEEHIIINDWLAADLGAGKGDKLEIEYYVIGFDRRLIVKKSEFIVHSVIPLKDSGSNRALMPRFPGLSDAGDCRDWRPGIPVDLDMIRKKDEDYWDDYRGTPKAFIHPDRARKIWGNQFGNQTGIRFNKEDRTQITDVLRKELGPDRFGYYFRDIRHLQLRSSEESVDFSELFLSLSFLIVISSLILTGLFFMFYTGNRYSQIGTLNALGFRKKTIYMFIAAEGLFIGILGSVTGVFAGILYCRIFLYALESIWQAAVGIEVLELYVYPLTAVKGFLLSILFCTLPVMLGLRSLLKKSIAEVQRQQFVKVKKLPRVYLMLAVGIAVSVLLIPLYTVAVKGSYSPVFFFTAGTLLLAEGILAAFIMLRKLNSVSAGGFTLVTAGLRSVTRKSGRSLSVIGLFSVGIFMIISISANRNSYLKDASERSSGTGGFSFFCRTTHPVTQDMNTAGARRRTGLDEKKYDSIRFVHMRLLSGDDASCLNPKRTFSPAVLGVKTGEFTSREAFSFSEVSDEIEMEGVKNIWELLNKKLPDGSIPAVADSSVIKWGLGKSLGDQIGLPDENGSMVKIKLIAGLADSIFQGYVIISEKHFLEHFPSVSGFNVLLVDGAASGLEGMEDKLLKAFAGYGMDVVSAIERLAVFSSVQNTYLTIFLVLGGLGLILGSIGVGLLMVRNILERKGEMAQLAVLGYAKKLVVRMLLYEHIFLLFVGMAIGTVSGGVAVYPYLLIPGIRIPYILIMTILFSISLVGILSIYISSSYLVRGNLLSDLRQE